MLRLKIAYLSLAHINLSCYPNSMPAYTFYTAHTSSCLLSLFWSFPVSCHPGPQKQVRPSSPCSCLSHRGMRTKEARKPGAAGSMLTFLQSCPVTLRENEKLVGPGLREEGRRPRCRSLPLSFFKLYLSFLLSPSARPQDPLYISPPLG